MRMLMSSDNVFGDLQWKVVQCPLCHQTLSRVAVVVWQCPFWHLNVERLFVFVWFWQWHEWFYFQRVTQSLINTYQHFATKTYAFAEVIGSVSVPRWRYEIPFIMCARILWWNGTCSCLLLFVEAWGKSWHFWYARGWERELLVVRV